MVNVIRLIFHNLLGWSDVSTFSVASAFRKVSLINLVLLTACWWYTQFCKHDHDLFRNLVRTKADILFSSLILVSLLCAWYWSILRMSIYTHSYVLVGRAPACHVRSTGLIHCTLISFILLVPLFNFIIQLFIVIFFSPHDSEVSYHVSAWYVFFMVQKSPITCMFGLFLHGSEVSYHMYVWFVFSCHMYVWFVFSLFRSLLSHVCLVCFFIVQKFPITCMLGLLFQDSEVFYHMYTFFLFFSPSVQKSPISCILVDPQFPDLSAITVSSITTWYYRHFVHLQASLWMGSLVFLSSFSFPCS